MVRTFRLYEWLRGNWFLPLFALLLGIEFAFARANDWSRGSFAEIAVLIDLCLFIPALYVVCYRRKMTPRALALRAAALALGGIYIASKLVPLDAQTVLADLVWARNAGWALIALVELAVVLLLLKLLFGGASTDEIAAKTGAPPWVVRLMQIEARFWKALWRFLTGR